MIAHSEWKQDEVFRESQRTAIPVTFDADVAHKHGPSPMEAVLMALCACTSVDVVSILQKKRQELIGPSSYGNCHTGAGILPVSLRTSSSPTQSAAMLSRKAVEDAVSLSKNKYCSVSKMLEKAATIEYEIVYPDGDPLP